MKIFYHKSLFILVGIVLGVGLTFLYIQEFGIPFKKVLQNISKTEENKQIKQILDDVGKLIILPEDEEPVLATITDVYSLVKEQPFYKGAKDGDIVIVYQKSLKAIIYSPQRNIIVNVGPVSMQPEETKEKQEIPVDEEETKNTTKK